MRRFPPEDTNSKPQDVDAAPAREADLITVRSQTAMATRTCNRRYGRVNHGHDDDRRPI